jgi:hypothetical protein
LQVFDLTLPGLFISAKSRETVSWTPKLYVQSVSAYLIGIPTYRAVWSDAVRAGGASHGLIDALETSPSSIALFVPPRDVSPHSLAVCVSRHCTVAGRLATFRQIKILFLPAF